MGLLVENTKNGGGGDDGTGSGTEVSNEVVPAVAGALMKRE